MTISLPQEDVTFQTRQQLTERIAVCLGGRAAEQLALGDISTGAGNDLQKASAIARNMVTRYGMSGKVGNVSSTPATTRYSSAAPWPRPRTTPRRWLPSSMRR